MPRRGTSATRRVETPEGLILPKYVLSISPQISNQKKEEEASKQKRAEEAARLERERRIHESLDKWRRDIIPHWESRSTGNVAMRTSLTILALHRCTRSSVIALWRMGLPPSVRGTVWSLAMGNRLQITRGLLGAVFIPWVRLSIHHRRTDLFDILSEAVTQQRCAERAAADSTSTDNTRHVIELDLPRTLTTLAFVCLLSSQYYVANTPWAPALPSFARVAHSPNSSRRVCSALSTRPRSY